jgi:hypothetical protein
VHGRRTVPSEDLDKHTARLRRAAESSTRVRRQVGRTGQVRDAPPCRRDVSGYGGRRPLPMPPRYGGPRGPANPRIGGSLCAG